ATQRAEAPGDGAWAVADRAGRGTARGRLLGALRSLAGSVRASTPRSGARALLGRARAPRPRRGRRTGRHAQDSSRIVTPVTRTTGCVSRPRSALEPREPGGHDE